VTVTNYIWDVENDTCLMETDENGATKVLYSHEPTQFGGLISQRRDGQTYYHHYDALGSTRQLTDADENVTDEYVYTAWGEPVVANGTTENPYRWVGRLGYYWDEATGTYYIRRRDYRPTVARWTAVDSHWTLPTLGPYVISSNSPLIQVDPSGLFCFRQRGVIPPRDLDCGAEITWVVEWDPKPKRHGYILQRIRTRSQLIACDYSAYAETSPCPGFGFWHSVQYALEAASRPVKAPESVFWEMWIVNDHVVFQDRELTEKSAFDQWSVGDYEFTFGYNEIEAVAFFYETTGPPPKAEPPGGWGIWRKSSPDDPPSGLYYTCHDDARAAEVLMAGRPLAKRSMKAQWCCCGAIRDLGVSLQRNIEEGECKKD
jgi:RHS repeat-associated protein